MRADPSEWTAVRVASLKAEIRNLYWHIRTLRRGIQDAPRRRYYRKIARAKRELYELGASRREVLDLLACCRRRVCFVGCQACGKTAAWKNWV